MIEDIRNRKLGGAFAGKIERSMRSEFKRLVAAL
jgi:hypothetical protein